MSPRAEVRIIRSPRKVTKDMLDLAKQHRQPEGGRFEPEKFEDQYETALVDLINQKRAGKPITPKERPSSGTVVDLIEALRQSVGGSAPAKTPKKAGKKLRKASSGRKEMLMPIDGLRAEPVIGRRHAPTRLRIPE